MKDSWDALPGATVTGFDAAISAWTADLCNKTLGKELPKAEETEGAPRVKTAQSREDAAWEEFEIFRPMRRGRHYRDPGGDAMRADDESH